MPGLGYRIDLENHAQLAATAKPFTLDPRRYAAPRSISHRRWKKVKHQGQMGACSGGSRANGGEILNWIATGGNIVELSMMYCYLENQRACGLLGADQGATIDGSVRAAMETGFALESTFPYPDPVAYSTQIPAAAQQEGRKHLIRSHSVLRSYADVYAWLATGQGVVLIGVPWLGGMTRVGKTMDKDNLHGAMLGGHALTLEGYGGDDGNQVDDDGRPLVDMENTHGTGYGDGGYTLVYPRLIDYWGQTGAVMIGISDMEHYGFRMITTYAGSIG